MPGGETRQGSGGPPAFLTLSLVPLFLPQLLETAGFAMGINYGLQQVRLPAPLPVGSRLRAGAVVDSGTEVAGGVQLQLGWTFEVESQVVPACEAVALIRYYV
ncbi:MAG: putative enoyl-CoA hydratase 1 [Modestobacter sp.]|nr:putative enoyl-CoA hydratase 1 [Modestobacter sp.]